jgi:hypothetical protein
MRKWVLQGLHLLLLLLAFAAVRLFLKWVGVGGKDLG